MQESIFDIVANIKKSLDLDFDPDNRDQPWNDIAWCNVATTDRIRAIISELESAWRREAAYKASKTKKATNAREWNSAYPSDVQDAVRGILVFWPKKGLQPNSDPAQPIPNTSAPLLAARIAAIKKEGADLFLCVEIAKRYVDEWSRGEHWLKGAQFFFGERGPWQEYYRAEVTNKQMDGSND